MAFDKNLELNLVGRLGFRLVLVLLVGSSRSS